MSFVLGAAIFATGIVFAINFLFENEVEELDNTFYTPPVDTEVKKEKQQEEDNDNKFYQ